MNVDGGQADGGGRILPRLDFFDHLSESGGREGLSSAALEDLAERSRRALPTCLEHPAAEGSESPLVLGELQVVEISIISDPAIAAVHADFMNDPAPTDVITFHHGEILISADTARAKAEELGQPLLRELLLYVIHGLLHLNGHEDQERDARQRMHEIQERILQEVWPLSAS